MSTPVRLKADTDARISVSSKVDVPPAAYAPKRLSRRREPVAGIGEVSDGQHAGPPGADTTFGFR